MKISGSILAVKADYMEYARMLKDANVDYLHIDIFQNGTDFAIADILKFNDSYLPLDVHLIFNEISDEDIDLLNQRNVKYLNIQYEPLTNKEQIKRISQKFMGSVGLAITSCTEISVIDHYLDDISQILFMCSEPGVSGAKFDDSNYQRIIDVHRRYPLLELYADGGINNVIAEKMGNIGISMVVSGSYLCKDMDSLAISSYNLRFSNKKNIKASRIMIRPNCLPILTEQNGLIDIIDVMTRYRLGIVLIVENGAFRGVIGDGDIRRALIRYGPGIFNISAGEIMNRRPFCVSGNDNLEDIYKKLLTLHRGIDVIPVIEDSKLIGAINLRIGI